MRTWSRRREKFEKQMQDMDLTVQEREKAEVTFKSKERERVRHGATGRNARCRCVLHRSLPLHQV